ncbi:WAS/WASL-interacting protein family member 3-like [Chenopodium quinoa]|uniref:WAS/WASL-interacting protein family member 3-like n=1 Tax=Chenopodium quinoa TaxID=63459 RepID=UPI000B792544|nr:WAS/WASL-interacting protein family member 3-like [Chenopodium quinoa]XP_021758548.1 WAS/WASL-interacting protein family member 3-like [Chenopodium quinoa]
MYNDPGKPPRPPTIEQTGRKRKSNDPINVDDDDGEERPPKITIIRDTFVQVTPEEFMTKVQQYTGMPPSQPQPTPPPPPPPKPQPPPPPPPPRRYINYQEIKIDKILEECGHDPNASVGHRQSQPVQQGSISVGLQSSTATFGNQGSPLTTGQYGSALVGQDLATPIASQGSTWIDPFDLTSVEQVVHGQGSAASSGQLSTPVEHQQVSPPIEHQVVPPPVGHQVVPPPVGQRLATNNNGDSDEFDKMIEEWLAERP